MNCPICNVPLQMTERQGIEIDYCPQCRGVWLDRGELDKIIERSSSIVQSEDSRERHEYDLRDKQHESDKHGQFGQGKHRGKSFLEDLFD